MTDFTMIPAGVTILGWCLVHFLWEAAAIGVLYAAVRSILPRGNARYVVAMLALLLMAAMPVATAWHEWSVFVRTVDLGDFTVAASVVSTIAPATGAVGSSLKSALQSALPWLVLAWSLGVGVLGLRVAYQWRGLRAMLRASVGLPAWQARAQSLAERMGLRRVVPVLASVRVATPTLVGWLRPAVVLPLAVLARMSPTQIDLVLAHELAHLRRFDHVANLFQVVLETLFYYHPVVHWISRDARNERELCCDAMALSVTGGARRDFVAALAELEELRGAHPELALAASGGVLVERAWFIAGAMPAQRHWRVREAALLAIFVMGVVAIVAWAGSREAQWQRWVANVTGANRAATALRIVPSPLSVSLPAPVAASPHSFVFPLPTVSQDPDRLRNSSMPVVIESASAPALSVHDVAPQSLSLSLRRRFVGTLHADSTAEVDAPRPVHTVRPVYPSAALWAGAQAQVVVAFTLDGSGRPQNLEVVGSGNGPFDAAAMQALAAWRFSPPPVAGQRYQQAFTFVIDAPGTDDAATARACLVRTGTHICRSVADAPPVPRVQTLR